MWLNYSFNRLVTLGQVYVPILTIILPDVIWILNFMHTFNPTEISRTINLAGIHSTFPILYLIFLVSISVSILIFFVVVVALVVCFWFFFLLIIFNSLGFMLIHISSEIVKSVQKFWWRSRLKKWAQKRPFFMWTWTCRY